MARHPTLFSLRAGLAGAAQEQPLLLLWKASADGQMLDIHTYLVVCVYMWFQDVPRLKDSFYLAISGLLAGGCLEIMMEGVGCCSPRVPV